MQKWAPVACDQETPWYSSSPAASKPLKTHLADNKQALLDKGTTEAHAVKTAKLVEAILDGTTVVFQTDFTATAASRYLAERFSYQ